MSVPSQQDLEQDAARLLDELRGQGLMVATAESCTGGMIASALTSVAGSSDVVERGFVTYSNEAKEEMLGVDAALIETEGAVSKAVAIEMAKGALTQSRAGISVSVTGIAGPGGGSEDKPVGLVHLAAVRDTQSPVHRECRFGGQSRDDIRRLSVVEAFALVRSLL